MMTPSPEPTAGGAIIGSRATTPSRDGGGSMLLRSFLVEADGEYGYEYEQHWHHQDRHRGRLETSSRGDGFRGGANALSDAVAGGATITAIEYTPESWPYGAVQIDLTTMQSPACSPRKGGGGGGGGGRGSSHQAHRRAVSARSTVTSSSGSGDAGSPANSVWGAMQQQQQRQGERSSSNRGSSTAQQHASWSRQQRPVTAPAGAQQGRPARHSSSRGGVKEEELVIAVIGPPPGPGEDDLRRRHRPHGRDGRARTDLSVAGRSRAPSPRPPVVRGGRHGGQRSQLQTPQMIQRQR